MRFQAMCQLDSKLVQPHRVVPHRDVAAQVAFEKAKHTLVVFWALSPASERGILGTLVVFWALSPASEHMSLGTL
jgi:aromatic ring-cleaving dioxygenase